MGLAIGVVVGVSGGSTNATPVVQSHTAPSTHQPSQRFDPLPVLDTWWEQWRYWPIPVSRIGPILQQPGQHFDSVLPVDSSFFQQVTHSFP